jgi:hypothetical protein
MASRIDSVFQAYEFTEDEIGAAFVFTDLQTAYLKTELAIVATEKNIIKFDPDSPNATDRFIREHEYYRGRMETLQLLLGTSDDRKTALQRHLEAQSRTQDEG